MNAELRETIVSIALEQSPNVQKLLREREWQAMRIKHLETEAGLARKRLEAVNQQLKDTGYAF